MNYLKVKTFFEVFTVMIRKINSMHWFFFNKSSVVFCYFSQIVIETWVRCLDRNGESDALVSRTIVHFISEIYNACRASK